jgi:hypothetical protein
MLESERAGAASDGVITTRRPSRVSTYAGRRARVKTTPQRVSFEACNASTRAYAPSGRR